MSMPAALRGALLLAVWLFSACGYVRSGQWEDDPGNWGRAFGSNRPAGAEVLHSFYWRAPHFTYEAGYFFAIRDAGGFKAELFSRNRLLQLPADAAATAREGFFGRIPKWFVPGPAARYEVWMYADQPRGNFRVFVDKNDGTVFLADYQV